MSGQPPVEFFFDTVCPFAYIASTRISSMLDPGTVLWTPVLLGGLYAATDAPQGKGGSATAVMSAAKRLLTGHDLLMQAERFKVPLRFHPRHPVATLSAQRLLTFCPAERRPQLASLLFRAYWVFNEDVDDAAVLRRIAREAGVDADTALADAGAKEALRAATEGAAALGAFGVPTFAVRICPGSRKMFYGGDRLHMVAAAAGQASRATLPRVAPTRNPSLPRRTVRFYYDLSSPWSFLGFTQIWRLHEVAAVEFVPVLVGAIFKAIGGPMLPASALSAAKRAWAGRDLELWADWWKEPITFPSEFPIRSVTALRCVLAEPACAAPLFRAAWQRNVPISSPAAVRTVLAEAGFDAAAIMARAETEEIKQQLKANTDGAVARGLCGVPSYEVLGAGDGILLFGQDRIDTVMDLCCGWSPSASASPPSKL